MRSSFPKPKHQEGRVSDRAAELLSFFDSAEPLASSALMGGHASKGQPSKKSLLVAQRMVGGRP